MEDGVVSGDPADETKGYLRARDKIAVRHSASPPAQPKRGRL
jgi:hypothetical protein